MNPENNNPIKNQSLEIGRSILTDFLNHNGLDPAKFDIESAVNEMPEECFDGIENFEHLDEKIRDQVIQSMIARIPLKIPPKK